jgi:Cof subfamily protein (haloacid dehalogenase superfamily)
VNTLAVQQRIELLVSDVDGTLLTPEKTITSQSKASIARLRENGTRFTLASSRPVQGLKRFAEELDVNAPFGALNGGVFVSADFKIIHAKVLPGAVGKHTLEIFRHHGLIPWLYTASDWFVENPNESRVKEEVIEVEFQPKQCSDLSLLLDQAVKLVGVSIGPSDKSQDCDAVLSRRLGRSASVSRSHADFLDVTHPQATKGNVICFLSAQLGIPTNAIAAIGDMPNDIPMFEQSGIGIAMGNASTEVKRHANFVTTSNSENGLATAIDILLRQAKPSAPSAVKSLAKPRH